MTADDYAGLRSLHVGLGSRDSTLQSVILELLYEMLCVQLPCQQCESRSAKSEWHCYTSVCDAM